MNSTSLIPIVLRRSGHFGRLISCRQCWLEKCRLLAQPSHASVVSVLSRGVSTGQTEEESRSTGGLWSKIKFDLGFITGLKYPKSVLNVSGFRMYVCCTELIDHQQFFQEFNLPDTFNSWFLVTELHIWLCMVRLSDLGKDGRLLRNNLVKAMWEDVESRSKQLGEAASLTARKEGVRQLADVFHASLFAFDEGLLGDDKALASSVWRILFEMRPDVDPAHLENMVAYIRKQVAHMDQQTADVVLGRGFVSFLPLKGDSIDTQAAERQTMVIGKLRTKV